MNKPSIIPYGEWKEIHKVFNEECGECDGDGDIECCECGQHRDCIECDGTGEIKRNTIAYYLFDISMAADKWIKFTGTNPLDMYANIVSRLNQDGHPDWIMTRNRGTGPLFIVSKAN